MFVPMTGPILKDTATEKYRLVIRGGTARESALQLEPIFQASTAKRKMSMSKTYTEENSSSCQEEVSGTLQKVSKNP